MATHLPSGESACVRVLNSAGGALASGGVAARRRGRNLSLRFQLRGYGAFDADVALLGPAAKAEGEGLVAFRFQVLRGEELSLLSAFLCDEHAQSSNRMERLFSSRDATLELAAATRDGPGPKVAWSLLRQHVHDERDPFFLYDETLGATIALESVQFVECRGKQALRASLPAAVADSLDELEQYVFFFADALAATWFRARITKEGPTDVLIAAPSALTQGGFRCSRRVPPPWGYPVTASIENPHLYGEGISRPLSEVAGNGFSIEFDPAGDRLFPGQHVRRARLDLPSGSVETQCVLRSCRPGTSPGKMVAGFEVVGFRSPQDHDRWMRALIPSLFPQARIGDDESVSDAWARLERSGYLELIESSERSRLRKPFFDDWTRHASHPAVRARFVLSYRDGMPIGVAAANLVYPKTCLIHNGGIDKAMQSSGEVLGLYSAAFLFAHSMSEYCLALFDAERHVNATLFERFIQQYSTPADNVFDRLAVFKWQASHAVTPVPSRSARTPDIVSARGDLMRVLWEHQQRTLSPMELDAYGWSPDGRSMHQFSESCAADGYARNRQVFFALRDGLPLAALIAETGSEGMNMFSLLNACNVVVIECPDEERTEVTRSLLARAIDYYRGAGKEAFLVLCFSDHERHARLDELGFAYLAEGWRWLAARRVIPAYITYLQDLAALRRAATATHPSSRVFATTSS